MQILLRHMRWVQVSLYTCSMFCRHLSCSMRRAAWHLCPFSDDTVRSLQVISALMHTQPDPANGKQLSVTSFTKTPENTCDINQLFWHASHVTRNVLTRMTENFLRFVISVIWRSLQGASMHRAYTVPTSSVRVRLGVMWWVLTPVLGFGEASWPIFGLQLLRSTGRNDYCWSWPIQGPWKRISINALECCPQNAQWHRKTTLFHQHSRFSKCWCF